MSFPRKRESSFFALDPCFRRGDIEGFCFPQQILISSIYCSIPPYAIISQLQTKIYSTTPTTMTTVEIAKNFRRSKIIPRIPNTKAAGIERFIINPTRALIGLPQPGPSMILAPVVRAATISNVIAIFPKRIF